MTEDPLAPSVGPPPRHVEAWTHVPGHNIIVRHRDVALCSCGERAPKGGVASEWRALHLREAWPVLVPRIDGETYARWMERISEEHVEASKAELDEFEAHGGATGIAPGQPIPVISESYMRASDRVAVLEHQLEEVLDKVVRERGLSG